MAETPPTTRARITNSTSGPRYVHGLDGPVVIAAGATSEELEIRQGELDALGDGLAVATGDADAEGDNANEAGVRTIDTGGAAEGVDGAQNEGGDIDREGGGTGAIPDDLASDRSADGIVGREKLLDVAKAEGVTVETDDNKSQLVAKIVAARAAK